MLTAVTVGVLGGAALGLAVWGGSVARRGVMPNAGLVVAAGSLDFGEVWVTDDFEWSLRIHNPTETDVHILRFLSSCGCALLEPETLVVPAGRTVPVRLRLNLMPQPSEPDAAVRTFAARIVPVTATVGPANEGWEIHGTVRSAFTRSARALQFGGAERLVRGAGAWPSKSLTVHAEMPIARLVAECNPSLAQVEVQRVEDEPDAYRVVVSPSPELSEGEFAFAVRLTALLPSGERLPAVSFEVVGAVEPDIAALPTTVQVGPSDVGTAQQATVTLQSRSGTPFRIEGLFANCAFVTVEPIDGSSASVHQLRLSVRIPQPGRATCELNVLTCSDDALVQALMVPVHAFGRLPREGAQP